MSTRGLWAPPRFYGPPEIVVLTPAQFEVTRLLCRGLSNRQIAQIAKMSEDTVKTHLRSIYARMRCNKQNEVVVKLHSREMVVRQGYRPRGGVVDTR